MPLDIAGRAIFPRLSENDVFYWPQELEKFDGVTVPLRWQHIQTPEAIVGEATFEYDPNNRQVMYKGTITNEDAAAEVRKGGFKVSIGATVDQKACKDPDNCSIKHQDGTVVDAPVLEEIQELSIVSDPGIPESTLNILEGKTFVLECSTPKHIITSHEVNNSQKQLMTEEVTKEDCGCQKNSEAPAQEPPVETEKVEQECPPGQKWDGEKCVPMESESEDVPAQTKDVTVNVNVPKQESKEDKVDVQKIVSEAKESFMEEIRKDWTPKSAAVVTEKKVEEAKWVTEDKTIIDDAKKTFEKVLNEGHARIVLNKDDWIKSKTQTSVTEAISASGVSGVSRSTDIVIVPGQNTFKPVRQFGQFETIPKGENTHRFFKTDVPAFGALTESTSTPFTATTHTLTPINVTCNVRGWLQQVLKSEIEDYPEQLMSTIQETARMGAIKDESNLILTTLGGTAEDFNNGTTALTANFPAHISGSDGSFVDNGTTEDAVGEFDEDGIDFARQYLEQRGTDVINERIIAFLHPRAYRTLIKSTGLTSFTQEGDAKITATGKSERYLGVEIIVTNELDTQNNSYRNVVLVAGRAFGLASQRDMEIEMDKEINGQYVNIVTNHRIGVTSIDQTAYCIVSSKAD